VLGETAEGTEALLTRAELSRIIDARLQEERFSEDKRWPLVEQILEAAADRLVLLAQVRDGGFGFSLRSIQEFMAAEALPSGAVKDVAQRLRRLAPLPYWRNVVLLAVSKALSAEQTFAPALDDFVVGLCDAVRDAAPLGEDAMLAADILLEGSARNSPLVTETLVARGEFAQEVEARVRPELRRRASDPALAVSVPGWALLLALVDRGIAWAAETAWQTWPNHPATRRLLAAELRTVSSRWLSRTITDDLETFGPDEVGRPDFGSGARHAPVLLWLSRLRSTEELRAPFDEPYAGADPLEGRCLAGVAPRERRGRDRRLL